jgi:hypothetical protein
MYHFAMGSEGLTIRVVAFPSPELPMDPTLGKSRKFLQRLLDHLREGLPKVAAAQKENGQRPIWNPSPQAPKPGAVKSGATGEGKVSVSTPTKPAIRSTTAEKVRVKVLDKHSVKDSFWVQEEGEGKKRGILGYGKPPARLPEPGETIEVYLNNTNPQSPQYRWDPPPPPQSQQRRGGPPRGRR